MPHADSFQTIPPRLDRVARLLGEAGLERLARSSVAVFGLGGVGSFCAEALARSGIGELRLVDHDTVTVQTLNRQLQALTSTLGQAKVHALGERLVQLGPGLRVDARVSFFDEDTADALLMPPLCAVVDAIDSLGPKVALLRHCRDRGLPVITALGAGGRLDPTQVRIVPLAETRGDRLGMWTRKQLRRTGTLDGIMAVYSLEQPRPVAAGPWPVKTTDLHRGRQRKIQPSLVMVPAVMGMAAAAYVIRMLTGLGD